MQLFAAIIYVATTGNDLALGTQGAPVKTLSKAVSIARAGDLIRIGSGTFSEAALKPLGFEGSLRRTGTLFWPKSNTVFQEWSTMFKSVQNVRLCLRTRVLLHVGAIANLN